MDHLRECLIELQDFEVELDPRMPSGSDIVDEYVPHMLEQCDKCKGKILVGEIESEVAGYVTILTKVVSEELEDGHLEYGLVSDLAVKKKYRGRGLGRKLLDAAETYARASGVNWLRIGVLAPNQQARSLYLSMGFSDHYIELEKKLVD